MTKIREVAVAIVSWNGREHLEICLEALREQRDPGVPWKVWVLDNGSKDGTAAWLEREHPWVERVESPVNLGFCAANNRLVREAGADAVALLNNDTRPRPEWLGELVEALASAPEDVAAVSGKIVDWPGERLDFASGVMTFDGHAFQKDFGRPLGEVEVPAAGSELFFACGGNMLVRRESYEAAGGFDESYFAYLEDVDLGWRLWSGGERVLFAPEAVVHHRSMATSDLLGHANRGFLFERNAFSTVFKNFDEEYWQRLMPAVLWTLIHRTQTLLVQNNPGGEQLTFDPYAGLIADTARPEGVAELFAEPPSPTLIEKWKGYGPKDFFRRAIRKAVRSVLPGWILDPAPGNGPDPRLTDGRTVAQLRAITQLLGGLDRASAARSEIQARRRRSDREIFERFPLWVVPTYPGDERLFESPAFREWLGDDLPIVEHRLDEVMEVKR